MGLRAPQRQVMRWMSTLGAMKTHGTHVIASCDKPGCGHYWTVDLDEMIAVIGSPEATLWDRHGPCERDGCDGTVSYLASPGPGTPKRPLISTPMPPGVQLPLASMMDGWVGIWATLKRGVGGW